jgi:8-oxo-dGTP diphosphatase
MHSVGAVAVINAQEQVLLVRRSDLPFWALPGGGLDLEETMEACCIREVQEETGLRVEIERLVGLYSRLRGFGRATNLSFLFVCRAVGGALQTSDETTAIRYWPLDRLPSAFPSWHRLYLADTLYKYSEVRWRVVSTPWWVQALGWSLFGVRRLLNRLRGRHVYVPNPWRLGAFVTLFDTTGRVLLVRRRDYPVWNLPGGRVERNETPWDAAVREALEETGLKVELQRLTGVYHKPRRCEVVFNFEGRVVGGQAVPTDEGEESSYFPVDALPEPILPKHVERIRDSAARDANVVFGIQDAPSGLRLLGFE